MSGERQLAESAAAAARLVVEEGAEYAAAKQRAARDLGRRGGRAVELPGNEQLEDAVREHIALFCADEQPGELDALRQLARRWMQRLAGFRPHLAGAVWRGTATRRSAIHLDLYCDDPKAAQIELINAGVDFDSAQIDPPGRSGREPLQVLSLADRVPGWPEPVTLHLTLHDHDDLRGALRPDARGRTWRGDLAGLERLLGEEHR
ncbi:MAG: hypothetical protein ACK57L_11045 [Pseudomonadota bacterium]